MMNMIKLGLLLFLFAGTITTSFAGSINLKDANTYSEMVKLCKDGNDRDQDKKMCKDIVEMLIDCTGFVKKMSVEEVKAHKDLKGLLSDSHDNTLVTQCIFTKATQYMLDNNL